MRDFRLTILGLGLTLTITRKSCKLYLARDQSELRKTSTQSSRTLKIAHLICVQFASFLKAMPAPIPVWQYSCYPEWIWNSHTTHPPTHTILYFLKVKASTELKVLWSNCSVEMDGKSKLKLVISALCFCLLHMNLNSWWVHDEGITILVRNGNDFQ